MTKKPTIYSELKKQLLNQIENGLLQSGMQLPGENELASQFKISRPSVRKALNELEAANVIYRLPGKGSFVKDKNSINTPVKYLTIGVDFFETTPGTDWYYGKILNSVKKACMANNCRLTAVSREEISTLPKGFIDGMITMRSELDDIPNLSTLSQQGVPTVMINRLPDSPEIGYVAVDYRKAAQRGVEYLLDIGHRKIALIKADEQAKTSMTHLRTQGYKDAFAEFGLQPDKNLFFYEHTGPQTVQHLKDFLKTRDITAAFLTFGSFLYPFCQAANQLSINIPDDISLLCFDNVEQFAESCGFTVSEIRMPLKYLGKRSVEYLVNKITLGANCPVIRETVESSLVINSSCKRRKEKTQ